MADAAPRTSHTPVLRGALIVGVAVVVLSGALRLFVIGAYHVPSSSMEPTLLPGDFLIVNKLTLQVAAMRSVPWISGLAVGGLAPVRRGDVVVFDATGIREASGRPLPAVLVKRVVALPGDTVDVMGKTIAVNGQEVVRGNRGTNGPRRSDRGAITRYVVPRRGDRVLRSDVGREQWESYRIQEGSRETDFFEHQEALILAEDYYFVIGDNLGVSSDSRSWGPVAGSRIMGEALMVYWSADAGSGQVIEGSPPDGIRWDRIGRIIR